MSKLNVNQDNIEIINAKENNLKNVSVSIPKNKLVLFTGVSGSGKSSLVFGTIAVEASRLWQDSYPLYLRNKMPQYERPDVDAINNLTPSIVINQKQIGANSRSNVGSIVDVSPLIRLLFSRVGKPSAGFTASYNQNSPLGMCPRCTGLGEILELNEDKLFDINKTLNEEAIQFSQFARGWQAWYYVENPLLDPNKKLKDFTKEEWKILKYGPDKPFKMVNTSDNTGGTFSSPYEGVVKRFKRLYLNRDISKLKKKLQDEIKTFVTIEKCPECHGTGLNPKALASKINGKNIWEYNNMEVNELVPLLKEINDPIGSSITSQVKGTLERMIEVGVGYLSLNRSSDTLSGGEAQRLKIVKQIGSSLNNITYIFDEPTAGLHPDDAYKIANLLVSLRDKRNSVLVVEHSKHMIELADEIVELGPLSGKNGGNVVFTGTTNELVLTNTETAKALKEPIVLKQNVRPWTESFLIKDAKMHNLKNVTVEIPKKVLTAVTGVAGSGKSSLISNVFAKQYPESIMVSQKSIGTSSRSNPATYSGIMNEIRTIFAKTNNVEASWFSFNSKGACPVCKGRGVISPEVAFADAITIICEECHGKRYNNQALTYKYDGKNIEQVMAMSIDEALDFFNDEKITKKLHSLVEVGLGYMALGQATSTLSGGENQRLKLASELNKKGNTYILDEPSTGLSNYDIKKLLSIFNKLVDQGNTVIMIEHRLEMIAEADWIIDMGPKGGIDGGNVVYQGTVQKLLNSKNSITAKYLKEAVEGQEV